MNINNINTNSNLITPTQPESKTKSGAQKVGDTFGQALESLSQSENYSDNLLQSLAAGEDVELHQVMIASTQTDINFRIAMAIRDRLVEAYRDISRMPI